MEIRTGKHHHKTIFTLLFGVYALLFGSGLFIAVSPESAERLGRALFTQSIHITPSQNGLAKIHSQNLVDEGGLGAATHAGERITMQMNLISAARN